MKQQKYSIRSMVFGNREINAEIYKLLQQPAVKRMITTTQLSIAHYNPKFHGSQYPRLAHVEDSIVVTDMLIESLRKNSNVIINKHDADIIIASIALHDLGHNYFSHLSEQCSGKKHEEETYRIIDTELREFLENEFGLGSTNDVLDILRSNKKYKEENVQENANAYAKLINESMFKFAMSGMLVGGCDTDRIAYIGHDYEVLFGVVKNFTSICDYVTFGVVRGLPQIVFEEEIVDTLVDFFKTRLYIYVNGYFEKWSLILEENFVKGMKLWYTEERLATRIPEAEIIMTMMKYTSDKNVDFYAKRYASVISNQQFEDIICIRFENQEAEAAKFIKKLSVYIRMEEKSFYGIIRKKPVMYDSEKNVVYIRLANGIIKPIEEVSPFIAKKLSVDITQIYVDKILLAEYLRKCGKSNEIVSIIKNLEELFNAPQYEVEKKLSCDPITLGEVEKMFKAEFYENCNGEIQKNKDQYFITGAENDEVTARMRLDKGYAIKAPEDPLDLRSITKREEENLGFISNKHFLMCLNMTLEANGFKILAKLERDIVINTERTKYTIKYNGAIIEVAFDRSIYVFPDNLKLFDYMIEAELKEGEEIALIQLIMKFMKYSDELIPCEDSKVKRAHKFRKK